MKNAHFSVEVVASAGCLWRYILRDGLATVDIAAPVFEIDGKAETAVFNQFATSQAQRLPHGVYQFCMRGALASLPDVELEIVFRISTKSPVLRFCYRLYSRGVHRFTKNGGRDSLRYLSIDLTGFEDVREVCLSEFDEAIHSFRPTEEPLDERHFTNSLPVMGPILTAEKDGLALLAAYEHGSQVPDAFINFYPQADRHVNLEAVKGNYATGQLLDEEHSFETIWLQIAAVAGGRDTLANVYRQFNLHYISPNQESRQPYIFYNTWNFQERNKWWNGKNYLDSMHQERILAEIDIAHRMGIEVFVIDTGWYEKTGDWRVNRQRFPDGLKTVKERLDSYGMKLGLWFSPRQAALTSHIYQNHRDCRMAWNGEVNKPYAVWETEESVELCLVTRYWEAFADELIRLSNELGVTYFKWDAIHQYGCNDPGHLHGSSASTREERADCYAFELGRYMTRVVDKLCAACPQAIVDFDITEGMRSVGLGFLSAGKYFLINNGPYYQSLDDPHYAPGGGMGSNVFVFPGQARARLCRAPLGFDRWIPSVLFLTHYLPDDPQNSQIANLASLVLGQNGIWGDLPAISEEGINLFGEVLGYYRQVRADVTDSFPVISGINAGSPEIYEKIAGNGRGLVSLFASAPGKYVYITQHSVALILWASPGVSVTSLPSGQARLEVKLSEPGAALVFFGKSE